MTKTTGISPALIPEKKSPLFLCSRIEASAFRLFIARLIQKPSVGNRVTVSNRVERRRTLTFLDRKKKTGKKTKKKKNNKKRASTRRLVSPVCPVIRTIANTGHTDETTTRCSTPIGLIRKNWTRAFQSRFPSHLRSNL